MIPGTIDEWKAALASSKPGTERDACVCALVALGAVVEVFCSTSGAWENVTGFGRSAEYRVKPTARQWNAEDAKRHVGKAWRDDVDSMIGIVGAYDERGFIPWGATDNAWNTWDGFEYAEPKWGTDPSTWDWKKCEVVE